MKSGRLMSVADVLGRLGRLTLGLALGSSATCTHGDGKSPAQWAVDTVAVIGVETGDPGQEFGRLVAAEIGSSGDVFLLDLLRPGVFVLDGEGQFRDVTVAGRGPAELRQPRWMSLATSDRLTVLDPGNRRLVEFRTDGGVLTTVASIPLNTPQAVSAFSGAMCTPGSWRTT